MILFCILPQLHGQNPAEWWWSEATIHHTDVLGWYPKGHHLNLEPIVLRDSKVYRPSEWEWDQKDLTRTLTGTIGESIVVACRKMEGCLYEKATSTTDAGNVMKPGGKSYLAIPSARLCPRKKWECAKQIPLTLCCHQEYVGNYSLGPKTNNVEITKNCRNEPIDCWYNFTLAKPTYVSCRWQNNLTDPLGLKGLVHQFKINATAKPILSTVVTSQWIEGTESMKPTPNTIVTPQ